MPDGTLKFPNETDFSASTPVPTPRTTPVPTPVPTPKPTPEISPQREAAKGAVKKQKQKIEKREREKPRIIIIVRDDFVVPENLNHNQIKKEIFRGKTMKYVYVNLKCQPLEVKEYVKADVHIRPCKS